MHRNERRLHCHSLGGILSSTDDAARCFLVTLYQEETKSPKEVREANPTLTPPKAVLEALPGLTGTPVPTVLGRCLSDTVQCQLWPAKRTEVTSTVLTAGQHEPGDEHCSHCRGHVTGLMGAAARA